MGRRHLHAIPAAAAAATLVATAIVFLSLVCSPLLAEPDATAHNNWAVLVGSSRFWFNYRHVSNTLAMYRSLRRLGMPDSNIILMLADDMACNPRNRRPASVFSNARALFDLYGDSIEVDYRGYEVSVENFIRLLTGRHDPAVPHSKRLHTDHRSRVFIYLAGHGGDGFLKFNDYEELGSQDIADAVAQMHENNRYAELFIMVDTCQAGTLLTELHSPNVLSIGSSKKGQNSYSHQRDSSLGVSIIDSFTHHVLETFESLDQTSRTPLSFLFSKLVNGSVASNPVVREDLFRRPLAKTRITDFVGTLPLARRAPVPPKNSLSPPSASTVQKKTPAFTKTPKLPQKKSVLCQIPTCTPSWQPVIHVTIAFGFCLILKLILGL